MVNKLTPGTKILYRRKEDQKFWLEGFVGCKENLLAQGFIGLDEGIWLNIEDYEVKIITKEETLEDWHG